jgi:hypothetical protein
MTRKEKIDAAILEWEKAFNARKIISAEMDKIKEAFDRIGLEHFKAWAEVTKAQNALNDTPAEATDDQPSAEEQS